MRHPTGMYVHIYVFTGHILAPPIARSLPLLLPPSDPVHVYQLGHRFVQVMLTRL
jgi:hypothetical protein